MRSKGNRAITDAVAITLGTLVFGLVVAIGDGHISRNDVVGTIALMSTCNLCSAIIYAFIEG